MVKGYLSGNARPISAQSAVTSPPGREVALALETLSAEAFRLYDYIYVFTAIGKWGRPYAAVEIRNRFWPYVGIHITLFPGPNVGRDNNNVRSTTAYKPTAEIT